MPAPTTPRTPRLYRGSVSARLHNPDLSLPEQARLLLGDDGLPSGDGLHLAVDSDLYEALCLSTPAIFCETVSFNVQRTAAGRNQPYVLRLTPQGVELLDPSKKTLLGLHSYRQLQLITFGPDTVTIDFSTGNHYELKLGSAEQLGMELRRRLALAQGNANAVGELLKDGDDREKSQQQTVGDSFTLISADMLSKLYSEPIEKSQARLLLTTEAVKWVEPEHAGDAPEWCDQALWNALAQADKGPDSIRGNADISTSDAIAVHFSSAIDNTTSNVTLLLKGQDAGTLSLPVSLPSQVESVFKKAQSAFKCGILSKSEYARLIVLRFVAQAVEHGVQEAITNISQLFSS